MVSGFLVTCRGFTAQRAPFGRRISTSFIILLLFHPCSASLQSRGFQYGSALSVVLDGLEGVLNPLYCLAHSRAHFLPVCSPSHNETTPADVYGLGQACTPPRKYTAQLLGHHASESWIRPAPFVFQMQVNVTGRQVCGDADGEPLSPAQAQGLAQAIKAAYRLPLLLAGLPSATPIPALHPSHVAAGTPLGYTHGTDAYVFNHFSFHVLVRKLPSASSTTSGYECKHCDTVEHRAVRQTQSNSSILANLPEQTTTVHSAGFPQSRGEGPDSVENLPEHGSTYVSTDARSRNSTFGEPLGAADRGTRHLAAHPYSQQAQVGPKRQVPESVQLAAMNWAGGAALCSKGGTRRAQRWAVLGWTVTPCSVEGGGGGGAVECVPFGAALHGRPQRVREGARVVYTFDVTFHDEAALNDTSRWQPWQAATLPPWQARCYSLAIVAAGCALALLVRTLQQRLSKAVERLVLRTGAPPRWMQLSSSAFDPPKQPLLLCVAVGVGVQLFGTAMGSGLLALTGVVWSESALQLLYAAWLQYVLLGGLGSFVAVRLWTSLHGRRFGWRRVCAASFAVSLGGPVAALLTLDAASLASPRPCTALSASLAPTIAACAPLTAALAFFGAFLAQRAPALRLPACPSPPLHPPLLRRAAPPRKGLPFAPGCMLLVAGFVPFLALGAEAYAAGGAALHGWLEDRFLLVVMALLLAAVVTVIAALVGTYTQLRGGVPHWWWTPFARSAVTTACLLATAAAAPLTQRPVMLTHVNLAAYAALSLAAAAAALVCLGSIGFLASFALVYTLFEAVRSSTRGGDEGGTTRLETATETLKAPDTANDMLAADVDFDDADE